MARTLLEQLQNRSSYPLPSCEQQPCRLPNMYDARTIVPLSIARGAPPPPWWEDYLGLMALAAVVLGVLAAVAGAKTIRRRLVKRRQAARDKLAEYL